MRLTTAVRRFEALGSRAVIWATSCWDQTLSYDQVMSIGEDGPPSVRREITDRGLDWWVNGDWRGPGESVTARLFFSGPHRSGAVPHQDPTDDVEFLNFIKPSAHTRPGRRLKRGRQAGEQGSFLSTGCRLPAGRCN